MCQRHDDEPATQPPRNPADDKVHPEESAKEIETGPSYDASAGKVDQTNQTPEDAVDESSMESFPASDPPSHTTSRS